jgi:hypothetical protein
VKVEILQVGCSRGRKETKDQGGVPSVVWDVVGVASLSEPTGASPLS